jgi:hypothetical protein
MAYALKPLPFDPRKIKGPSERILINHHENNHGGAVRRQSGNMYPIGSVLAPWRRALHQPEIWTHREARKRHATRLKPLKLLEARFSDPHRKT